MVRIRSLLVALVVLVPACSSGDGDGEGSVTSEAAPALTVEAVLDRASEAMRTVETVAFEIERTGADVFIDDQGRLAFDAARGRYAAPASADAVLKVRALGLSTEVGAVAIDGTTWITNPLTGRWETAPESLSFDPATLFDDEVGWAPLLAGGLQDPQLVPPVPDADGRYHVRGTVGAQQVGILTGGLVDEATALDVWIDETTDRVELARFDVGAAGGVSTWTIELTDYGARVTITPPELGTSR